MPRLWSRRRFLAWGGALVGIGSTSGCGSILYPERIGQPPGPLDWKVVALDTIGLLLFLVPGIIAFVVDFANGTIYLPPQYHGSAPRPLVRQKLVAITVPREELTEERITQIVSTHAGRAVALRQGEYQTQELRELEEFWPTHEKLNQRSQSGEVSTDLTAG